MIGNYARGEVGRIALVPGGRNIQVPTVGQPPSLFHRYPKRLGSTAAIGE